MGLVGLTLRSGSATTFFLPAVLTLLAEAAALLATVAVGRPATGHVARWLDAVPADWRSDARLRRLFVEQDLLWAVVLALRSAVTGLLVLSGTATGAGLFRLTGTPMYIGIAAVCVRWARPVVSRTT